MELIRINDQRLKIMLTAVDMCHFEINAEHFFENGQAMHRTFRLLLEEINRQTDFEADDQHISVQYFPSREGGCEMFISKLPQEEATMTSPPTKKEARALEVRRTSKSTGGFRRDCAYRFAELNTLLCVCQRLRSIGYAGNSEAYLDERGDYFLCISICTASPFSMPEELQFLVEYGSLENAELLKVYIKEHGNVICAASAVHRLADLL